MDYIDLVEHARQKMRRFQRAAGWIFLSLGLFGITAGWLAAWLVSEYAKACYWTMLGLALCDRGRKDLNF